MTAKWAIRRLGDLLEVQNGYAFDSKEFNPSKGMPLIRIRSLNAGVETKTRFSGSYDNKYVVNAGDLLIGMDGEFGCYAWKGEPALLNQRVCRLQGFDLKLLPRFLFYGVNSYLKAIEEVTGYTTVKHLSSKQILDIDFPIPPLPEQQHIVTLLDEAFDGIATAKAHTEKNLQNALAIFESHLQSVFDDQGAGWKRISFEDVVDSECTLSYGIVQPGEEYAGGMPIVRPTDLGGRTIEIEGLKRIDPALAASYRRTTLRGGDLLLCVRGTTGQISTACKELAGANVTRGIVPIFFEPTVVAQDFGYYLMCSGFVQTQIKEKTYGTALQQINIGDLRKLKLAIPPLAEQAALTARFDELGG